jgi:hypothetical protein
MLLDWFLEFETYILIAKIKTYEIFNAYCVVPEINFPTTLCTLDLKVVWKCYGNQSDGGVKLQKKRNFQLGHNTTHFHILYW